MLSRIPARESTHTNGGSHGTSLMAQWQENAAKVNQALQDLADNLRATDSSMEANESETENSFAQLLGGL